MGHLVWRLWMMTLWTGFKQPHSASDRIIGPNEEGLAQSFMFVRNYTRVQIYSSPIALFLFDIFTVTLADNVPYLLCISTYDRFCTVPYFSQKNINGIKFLVKILKMQCY